MQGLRLLGSRREESALRARADAALRFLELERFADHLASGLPAGTQRLIEVGRVLAGSPRLVLFDEPAAGLDDTETLELADLLKAVRSSDITMIIIEHNVGLVMSISDRILVLDAGKTIADDVPVAVQHSPEVTRTSGSVNLEGKPIRGKSAHEIARMGIGLVPEGRHLFPELSVRDNLRMGMYGLKVGNAEASSREDDAFELFPILGDFSNRMAGLLSGGQQQMLAIGRALVRRPRVLLLDEPSLGLAPLVVQQILQTVRADRGVGILLAEQNAAAALRIADVGVVMENGRVTINQPAAELLADDHVSRHYLGVSGPQSAAHTSSATELPVALRRREL